MSSSTDRIEVSGIDIEWDVSNGVCTFEKLPVVMIWIDTSLAGLFSGVQAMVGTERYLLALQSEGRKSVAEDWNVISQFPDFRDGFRAIANIAAVAGWGQWQLVYLDMEKREACFRISDVWEGGYQKALGVCWGSGFLAGKVAGYCTKLFETNCWAEQTSYIAGGDPYDEFVVRPSSRSIEVEMESLLATDKATRADMAVALRRLEKEIAERERTEERLRESEQRYRAIFEGAVEGILIDRLDTKEIVYANPAVRSMLGHGGDKVPTLALEEIHPPGILDKLSVDSEGRPGEQSKKILTNVPCLRKDGSQFLVDIAVGRIIFGGVECSLKFYTDVTDRKRAEEAIQKTEKLESLGVLAGGIAHDFNNLLLGMFANIELARSLCDSSNINDAVEEIKECLDDTLKVYSRTKDLTKQLLTFAKGGTPARTTGSLVEMVRETARFALSGSNVSCEFHVSDDLWMSDFDENQMAHVVQNIILNAQQAMPMGGEISVRMSNVMLQGGEYQPLDKGNYVQLSFEDTGLGIDQEMLKTIFDPFFTTKQKGSGMGLATSHSIVAQHDGHIEVESELGKGSTFHVILPASENQLRVKTTDERCEHEGSGRILVMDDEPFIRQLAKRLLERLGYAVTVAGDGREALELFGEGQRSAEEFKAVILDLTVPGGLGGRETMEGLRREDPSVVIIAASGYSDDPIISEPARYGFNAAIGKPFTPTELSKLLNRLLEA